MTKAEYRRLEEKTGEALEEVRAVSKSMRVFARTLETKVGVHNALQALLMNAWAELDEQTRRELMSEKDELPFSDVEEAE